MEEADIIISLEMLKSITYFIYKTNLHNFEAKPYYNNVKVFKVEY